MRIVKLKYTGGFMKDILDIEFVAGKLNLIDWCQIESVLTLRLPDQPILSVYYTSPRGKNCRFMKLKGHVTLYVIYRD